MTTADLPKLNAAFNGLSTLLLLAALFAILGLKNWRLHAGLMIAALVSSSLFLIGYLVHKFYHPNLSMSRFPGVPGAWKTFYLFVILFPHLILAVVMLPFIGMALWHAYHRQWDKHRRIVRRAYPMWLYVSITGVLIYWLLYHYFPSFGPVLPPTSVTV